MPLPHRLAELNKVVTHRLTRPLVGHGPFVELEHVGRRTGRVHRTPMNAFRQGDTVTIALTYGSHTDWLRNIRVAGGCRMRMGREVLTLGPPHDVPPAVGMSRMPALARLILPRAGVDEFVEMHVTDAARVR
jgi:deazaflavin-dependent oxidoreductase (nitroreductase family)